MTVQGLGGRPKCFESPEELQQKIDDYFRSDDAYTISWVDGEEVKAFTPTMSGLALYLDVDRKTIVNYGKDEQYFHTIKKARLRIESHIEKKLYGNNVTGLIFNLKNNFDWKDKTEVNQTNVEMSHDEWIKSLE